MAKREAGAEKLLNIGVYAASEAARIVSFGARRVVATPAGHPRVAGRDIRRWLGGYGHPVDGERREWPPLWTPEVPRIAGDLVLGFRDLLELLFVVAFRRQGLSVRTIRRLIDRAFQLVEDPYPLSSPGFRTDGRRILADTLDAHDQRLIFDLESGQQLLDVVFDRLPFGIEYQELMRARWWPLGEDRRVLLDPTRRFGRPIVPEGVPTSALARSVAVERSLAVVAEWYEVSENSVKDAVEYETRLRAA